MQQLKKLEKLWINLKKSAPGIFYSYASRKIAKLEQEIKELREEYKEAETEEEKKKIKEEGTLVKLELEMIKNLLKENGKD